MAAVLDMVGVGVRRGANSLLTDISWAVNEDERWVILGPNGAGKTTLLSIAAAQLHPTSGMVDILGEILGAVDVFELRPRIGVVSALLAERIPGHELVSNVVISAAYAVLGRWRELYDPSDEARAFELMTRLRVAHLADRTYGTLSEGEKKRVQIARALMTDPELLLLDEPAAALDLTGREALVETLSGICLDSCSPATILVTHHLEEIPEGVTHALILKDSRIVHRGPIETVITSETVSEAFDYPLTVTHEDGRWAARAAHRRAQG